MTEAEKTAAIDSEKLAYLLNVALTNQAMLNALLDSQAHLLAATGLNTDHQTAKKGLYELVDRSRQIVIAAAEEHLSQRADELN